MGKLTVKEVQKITKQASPGRYSDGGGLYLMLPKSGLPYWMLRFTTNKKRRELTIGKQIDISLADARSQAEELKRQIRAGIDPLTEKHRQNDAEILTVKDLFNDWYSVTSLRLKHPSIPKRVFEKEIEPSIGRYQVDSVVPMDIRAIIRAVAESGRPSIANDTLMYLKQLFNHAVKLGLVTYNPASAFDVKDAGGVEKSRSRALSIEELEQAFKIFRQHRTSFSRDNYLACALLIVLGVRKTELTESKWSEFDLDIAQWKVPEERSKSGISLTIPLPPQVIEWLEELKIRACGSEYVFPSRKVSKLPHMGRDTLNRAIAKLFGVEPGKKNQTGNLMGDLEYFTVHDLRRTCRSLLSHQGVPSHIAERCLNHKIKGIEGIYDRYDYLDERRLALKKIATAIAPIVND